MSESRLAPDLHRVADLLVRCSGVPLPTIASALGFSEPEGFCRWFEESGGLHPEAARAEWRTPGTPQPGAPQPPPASDAEDGPDEQAMIQMRRCLFAVLDRRAVAPMVRAMRSRKPMPTRPKPRKGGRRA